MPEIRGQVADVLQHLTADSGPLHVFADDATWRRHVVSGTDPYAARYTPARLRVHDRLIERFLAENDSVPTDGKAVVVTAGPPAVGKSTRLDALGFHEADWRRIDADNFKVRLIKHDIAEGVFVLPSSVAGMTLPDARPVMPLELSGLYHLESAAIADKVRERCLSSHENTIIEGTLSHPPPS